MGFSIPGASVGDGAVPGSGAWASLKDVGDLADIVTHALPTDLFVLPAPEGRSVIGAAAQYLAAHRPDLSLVVVHAGAGSRNIEVGEIFAGS